MKKVLLFTLFLILITAGSLFAQTVTITDISSGGFYMNYNSSPYSIIKITVDYNGSQIWNSAFSNSGQVHTGQTTVNSYMAPNRQFLIQSYYYYNGYYYHSGWYTYVTTLCDPPSLSSPGYGVTMGSNSANLTWYASTNASYYIIYLGVNSSSNMTQYTSTTATSYNLTSLNWGTNYYWAIAAVNGESVESSISGRARNFYTPAPPAPGAPTISAATSITTSSFQANWGASSYATNYYLDVSTNASFSGYVSGYQNLSVGNTTYRSVSSLTPNTYYYYRVRAYNTTGTSGNSGTGGTYTLPNAATTPSPTSAATGVSITPSLSWTAPSGGAAGGYKIYLGTNNPPTNIINGTTQTATTYAPSALNPSTTYYWKAVAYNGSGDTPSPTTWSFTTVAAQAPVVTTQDCSSITQTSFTANGTLTSLGIPGVTQYGHCWSTSTNPTISNTHSSLGTPGATGTFTSSVTGLTSDTWYYVKAYATNAGGTVYGNQVMMGTPSYLPEPALNPVPANNATSVAVYDQLNFLLYWDDAIGSVTVGDRIYFGTDNPPTNIENGSPDGLGNAYRQIGSLLYNTTYYWKIIPWNYTGDAANCPVWSFTTIDQIVVPLEPVVTDLGSVTTEVTIPDVTGTGDVFVTVEWAPAITGFSNVGLLFTLTPISITLPGRNIIFTHNLGYLPLQIAYRIAPAAWTILLPVNPMVTSWTTLEIAFTLPATKADGDLEVIFPDQEGGTLPVELSSFTAIQLNTDLTVKLNWTTQTETSMSGYYVYRNATPQLGSALNLNQFVPATNSSSSHTYTYNDIEELELGTYYYWLQILDLDGSSSFFGPVSVTLTSQGDPGTPPIVVQTGILSIYPNPFNPNTTIQYGLKNVGAVSLDFFNARGQQVKHMEAYHSQKGNYTYNWTADNLSSGIYYVQMKNGNFQETKKLVLMK